MKHSLKDVARLAGVSLNTASRVVNKRGYLSDNTIKKVNKAIESLDYQPNVLARTLHGKKSQFIGLILPNLLNPFYAELANILETKLFGFNYKLILCNSMEDSSKERYYLRMLNANQVDGIITSSHNTVKDYDSYSLPIVAFDRYLGNGIPTISSDNYSGGKLAANKLIISGAKHILFFAGNEKELAPTNDRVAGFKDAVGSANVDLKVLNFPFHKSVALKRSFLHKSFMSYSPDAVMASDDSNALLCIEELKNIGLNVPENVQVIGYDGSTWIRNYCSELTTIVQPIADIADVLVETLLSMIDKDTEKTPNQVVLPISLHAGTTTI